MSALSVVKHYLQFYLYPKCICLAWPVHIQTKNGKISIIINPSHAHHKPIPLYINTILMNINSCIAYILLIHIYQGNGSKAARIECGVK